MDQRNIETQSVAPEVGAPPSRRLASEWVGHSVLNTLEHGVTRGSDAATTLLLLWFLSPETFSKLAFAQALAAPCLLFFIAPETVIYRDYSSWKAEGRSVLVGKIGALRKFGYLKALVAIAIALLLALANHEIGSKGTAFGVRFFALLWAFTWVLAPQFCGADREFLRVDLKLKHLNFLSLFQKLSMLGGTTLVLLLARDRTHVFAWLLAAAALSAGGTAAIARFLVVSLERKSGTERIQVGFWKTVIEAIGAYSLWQHFMGVIQAWIQTMDVFFLGTLKFAARGVGLYAAVLKIANLSMALPLALSNVFTIWLGRDLKTRDRSAELRNLWRFTGWIALFLGLQAVILVISCPWLLSILSRGRWLPVEEARMLKWFEWVLLGSSLFGVAFLLNSWLSLKAVREALFRVYVPWLGASLAIYFLAIHHWGFLGAAIANVPVALIYLALAGLMYRKQARSR